MENKASKKNMMFLIIERVLKHGWISFYNLMRTPAPTLNIF
jgi:hypothetical protein